MTVLESVPKLGSHRFMVDLENAIRARLNAEIAGGLAAMLFERDREPELWVSVHGYSFYFRASIPQDWLDREVEDRVTQWPGDTLPEGYGEAVRTIAACHVARDAVRLGLYRAIADSDSIRHQIERCREEEQDEAA